MAERKLRARRARANTEHAPVSFRETAANPADEGLAQRVSGDSEILSAFEQFRAAYEELKACPPTLSDEDQERMFGRRMDAADATLKDVSATTIAGTVAKLRRLFMGMVEADWASEGLLDRPSMEFRRQLELADIYDQMLWGVIEDLQGIETDLSVARRSAEPTLIEAIYRRWEEAQESYSANDRVKIPEPATEEEMQRNQQAEEAKDAALATAKALENAILMLEPHGHRDAQILLYFASNAIAYLMPASADAGAALRGAHRASCSALDFLNRSVGGGSFGRNMDKALAHCRRQIDARSGRASASER